MLDTKDQKAEVETRKALIEEVLEAYPEKARKKRAKHLGVTEEGKKECGVKSNIKSVPGVMTARGCAYAGSKGVVWGPIKDMVHISHGVPWMEFNFFGPTKITESLRAIAAKFDEKIQENAERVIAKYQPMVDTILEKYRPRLEEKTVMLFVGGLRPRHTIPAFKDLGIKCIGTGYEFAHNDDYNRTTHYSDNATVIYDDVTAYEFEEFVKKMKPDMIASGIKEKYVFQKMGVPFRQMHSYDYSGPYHGYDGFAIFARDMDMALNNPAYDLIRAKTPWKR